VIDETF
jgi:WD40 repeat protein